jgi:hypothetical protein
VLVQIPICDFAQVISEITESGMTKAHLARKLNVPFTTLDGWAKGSRPSWHYGSALLIVQKEMRESREAVTHEGNI